VVPGRVVAGKDGAGPGPLREADGDLITGEDPSDAGPEAPPTEQAATIGAAQTTRRRSRLTSMS